jgi:signal transduction histidine kinase
MKKRYFPFHPVAVFVTAQVAGASLIGLLIYWYVSNYIIFNKVGNKISPQLVWKSTNVVALVTGLVLVVSILVGLVLIFIYLNRELNLNRMYDNFISNITHELKSPLTSIQLYLETLKLREVERERQKEFYDLMLRDAHRLQKLINSILEISALEQKRIAHHFQIYKINQIVRRLLTEAEEQFKLSPGAIRVTGYVAHQCVIDRQALKIVFDNLIDNAIKYRFGQLDLTVSLSATARNVIIEFADKGIGIEVKKKKAVFHKFFRLMNPNSPNVKGTGLGLYWVKEIIKYHGGKVSVSSEGENKGATFKIELPIYETTKPRRANRLLKITRKSQQNKPIELTEE